MQGYIHNFFDIHSTLLFIKKLNAKQQQQLILIR